jgi:CRISPR-associated protein Cas2
VSGTARRAWLVAYDIADERRLARVHRYLTRRAFALQYSVFVLETDVAGLNALLRDLARLISPRRDDVRVYPLRQRASIHNAGRRRLPDGIVARIPSLAPDP